jgi:hypothetical protein
VFVFLLEIFYLVIYTNKLYLKKKHPCFQYFLQNICFQYFYNKTVFIQIKLAYSLKKRKKKERQTFKMSRFQIIIQYRTVLYSIIQYRTVLLTENNMVF